MTNLKDIPADFNADNIDENTLKLFAVEIVGELGLSTEKINEVASMLRSQMLGVMQKITGNANISDFHSACEQDAGMSLTPEMIGDTRCLINEIIMQNVAAVVQSKMSLSTE